MPKKRKKATKAKDWKSVIDDLPDQVADEAKTEAKEFVNQLLSDSNEFTQRQGKKITGYLEQYAKGELTAEELKECTNDVALLTEMHAAKESLAGKQKFQKVALDISGILIKGALAALL
jgi:polyhydroxyalkanoate synthesis regulator phasin